MARVPPSLISNWFYENKIEFCSLEFPQFGTVAFCVSTIWHIAILCFHNFPIGLILQICVSTIWHSGILCFHNLAQCHFVFPQNVLQYPETSTMTTLLIKIMRMMRSMSVGPMIDILKCSVSDHVGHCSSGKSGGSNLIPAKIYWNTLEIGSQTQPSLTLQ